MGHLVVQAGPVPEDGMLAELLPMIGSDDDPGLLEDARGPQLAEEAAEFRVQAEQAIVVEVDQATGDRVQLSLPFGPPIRRADVPRVQRTPTGLRDGLLSRRDRVGPELSGRGRPREYTGCEHP